MITGANLLSRALRLCVSLLSLSALSACAPAEPEVRSLALDYGSLAEFIRDEGRGGDERAGALAMAGATAGDVAGEERGGTTAESVWPDIRGYWRIDHHTVLRSELPVLLEEVETVIDAVLIGEVTQDEDELWVHYRVCDVYMENTPGYNQTLLPDTFLNALAYRTRPAQLTRSGSEWSLRVPQRYELRGLTMTEPARDPFPVSDHDARIFDQDLDLKPGMSARLIGFPEGDVSLIQRTWDSWMGALSLDTDTSTRGSRVESVRGVIEWDDEQTIIAASSDVLKIEVDRWVPQEPELHHFEMRRVTTLVCPPRRAPPIPNQ